MTETTASPAGERVAPIKRTVEVPTDSARAFEAFTGEIGQWWPLATHSVFGVAGTVAFTGSALIETGPDGATTTWGEVKRWDPPQGFAITWHPGGEPEGATFVAVDFRESADSRPDAPRTLVTLTHSGWERRPEARDGYVTGWPSVLGDFLDHAR